MKPTLLITEYMKDTLKGIQYAEIKGRQVPEEFWSDLEQSMQLLKLPTTEWTGLHLDLLTCIIDKLGSFEGKDLEFELRQELNLFYETLEFEETWEKPIQEWGQHMITESGLSFLDTIHALAHELEQTTDTIERILANGGMTHDVYC